MDNVLEVFVLTVLCGAVSRYICSDMKIWKHIFWDFASAALILLMICINRPIELNSLVAPTGWLVGCLLARLFNRMP